MTYKQKNVRGLRLNYNIPYIWSIVIENSGIDRHYNIILI